MLSRSAARRLPPSGGRYAFAEKITAAVGARLDAGSQQLIEAFAAVPREEFVEQAFASRAYEDNALPIGMGQTISKPSTVARMLVHAQINPGDKVLEIGVGCGYVSAVLAALGAKVFGIERLSALAQMARRRLDSLGMQEVLIRCADGARGWRELAPFDVIIVSAAFDVIPQALFDQLDRGVGRLVAPVVDENYAQNHTEQRLKLWRSRVHQNTEEPIKLVCEDIGPCQFVAAT